MNSSPGANPMVEADAQTRLPELNGNANENGLHEMSEQGVCEMSSGPGSVPGSVPESKPRRIVELP